MQKQGMVWAEKLEHSSHTHTHTHIDFPQLSFFFFLKTIWGPDILRITSTFHFECIQMTEP